MGLYSFFVLIQVLASFLLYKHTYGVFKVIFCEPRFALRPNQFINAIFLFIANAILLLRVHIWRDYIHFLQIILLWGLQYRLLALYLKLILQAMLFIANR